LIVRQQLLIAVMTPVEPFSLFAVCAHFFPSPNFVKALLLVAASSSVIPNRFIRPGEYFLFSFSNGAVVPSWGSASPTLVDGWRRPLDEDGGRRRAGGHRRIRRWWLSGRIAIYLIIYIYSLKSNLLSFFTRRCFRGGHHLPRRWSTAEDGHWT
jgi:hypothetical protein